MIVRPLEDLTEQQLRQKRKDTVRQHRVSLLWRSSVVDSIGMAAADRELERTHQLLEAVLAEQERRKAVKENRHATTRHPTTHS